MATDGDIIKTGFSYVRDNDAEDGGIYEALFPLLDDGTPDSAQHLLVRVVTHEGNPLDVTLEVLSMNKTKRRTLGALETRNMEAASCLLYGAARLVTRKVFEPC